MQFPITIGLHRSFFACCAVLVLSGLACAVVLATPWSNSAKCVLLIAIALAGIFVWPKLNPVVQAIRLEKTGTVSLLPFDSSLPASPCSVKAASVHLWLVVIRYETEDQDKRTLVLLFDSAKEDDLRRLRVFLRWRINLRKGAA